MFTRDQTKKVQVGAVALGGGEPVRVESMAKTDTRDVNATLAQLDAMAAAGCELARAAAARAAKRANEMSQVDATVRWRKLEMELAGRLGASAREIGRLALAWGSLAWETVEARERDAILTSVIIGVRSLLKLLLLVVFQLAKRQSSPGPEECDHGVRGAG